MKSKKHNKNSPKVNAHSKSRQFAIVNALLMEEPGQKKRTAQKAQAKRQRAQAVSKWNDKDILKDRVARRLLRDIIDVLDNRSKIKTLRLIDMLNADEAMPWYVFRSGKPIGVYHFSQLLGKFDIQSEYIPFNSGGAKGFHRNWFIKAWRRVVLLLASKTTKVKK